MAKPMLVAKRRRPEVTDTEPVSSAVAARDISQPATPAPVTPLLSDSERYAQISLCAYFRAERRGFEPGHMWDDWLAAEEEVGARHARAKSDAPGEKKA
jgi:hypothetical protein